MATYYSEIEVLSEARPTFHDVTGEVIKELEKSGIKNGLALVYSKHTTCSVFIQEDSVDTTYKGDQFLLRDFLDIMEELIPTCNAEGRYMHPGPKHIEWATGEGEEAWWCLNTDAHLRSMLLGRSECIPVIDGRLEMGQFGKVFFVDFDQTRDRKRTVIIQFVGE